MTIANAIRQADEFEPNAIPDEIKIRLLSELDGRTAAELHLTEPREPYSVHNIVAELLIPYPYDAIYRSYLCEEIAIINGDIDRAQYYALKSEEVYSSYRTFYMRTFDPDYRQ